MTRLLLLIFLISTISVKNSWCQYQNQNQNQYQNPTQPQSQNQNYVTVNCSQGAVQGRTVNYGTDQSQLYSGQANVFSGIPYCQPPVGNLRLQPPQAINSFNTTLHDATYFRPKCPQNTQNTAGTTTTNEDCLYLNIYTPQAGNQNAQLAVLVMIDGSNGFSNGGCDESQVKGIVSNLVQRQIVVVTLQYRIGALGFFTTYTNAVQSNLGMLDQVQAMTWIKSEIVNFGGDPNKITVAGQDDGACAVSAHCLSPMSQNLFNQAIVQSGSIYSCYNPIPAVPTNPSVVTTTPRPQYDPQPQYGNANSNSYNSASSSSTSSTYNAANAMYDDPNKQLAETLCNISSDQWNAGQTQNLQSCLKNYTVDFFVNQKPNGPTSTWMIVRDNTFLPGSIDSLSAKRPNIPIIIGTVQDEDADYAFKLINNGQGGDPSNMQNWMFDFARKNKLNQTMTNQVSNIISNNYGGVNTAGGSSQNQGSNIQYDAPQNNQGYTTTNQGTNQGNNQQYSSTNTNAGVYQFQQNTYQNQNQNQYPSNNNNQGYVQQNTNQGGYQYTAPVNTNNNYNNQGSYGQQQQQPQPVNQYTSSNTGFATYQQNTTYFSNGNQGANQNQNINQGYNQQASNPGYYQQNVNQGVYQQNTNQQVYAPANNNQGYNQQNTNQGYTQQNSNQGYNNVPQYDAPRNQNGQQLSTQQLPSGVTDYSQLKTLTQVASDQSVSLTTTQVQSFMENGNRHVRIYQFTHVSEVGRQTVPNTGANWKPVFKGQDMYFITMSETIWTNCNYTAQDRQVANDMGQRWTDFVKTGQVANWDTTSQQNYNYCNLNTQPTQQSQYGQQARQVFQDQINPICQQAQNDYAVQNNLATPYPAQSSASSSSSLVPAPTRTPGTAQVQYTNGTQGQNFHISFQVNSFPFNG